MTISVDLNMNGELKEQLNRLILLGKNCLDILKNVGKEYTIAYS